MEQRNLPTKKYSQKIICPKELLQSLHRAPEEAFEGHLFSYYSNIFQVHEVSTVYGMQLATVINGSFC